MDEALTQARFGWAGYSIALIAYGKTVSHSIILVFAHPYAIGISLMLTLQCVRVMMLPTYGRIAWPLMLYIVVLWALSTAGIVTQIVSVGRQYIDFAEVDFEYYSHSLPMTSTTMCATARYTFAKFNVHCRYIILTWFTNGLLVMHRLRPQCSLHLDPS